MEFDSKYEKVLLFETICLFSIILSTIWLFDF